MVVSPSEADVLLDLARQVEAHEAQTDWFDWVRRLEERSQDIEPALSAFLDAGDTEAALDLAGCLSLFWQDSGRVDEGLVLTRRALAEAGRPETLAAARALMVSGELAFRQGDQVAAVADSTLAGELADALGDTWVAGCAELNLARTAFRDGDAPRTFQHATRVLERAGDNGRLRAGGTHMLGWAEYTAGNLEGAVAHFRDNVELYRRLGHRTGEASELANLADLAMEAGDHPGAAELMRAALDVPGATESRYLAPSLVRSVGVLCGLTDRPEAALALMAGTDALYERLGITPDPGDDVSRQVLDDVRATVTPGRSAAILDGIDRWTLPELVARARRELG